MKKLAVLLASLFAFNALAFATDMDVWLSSNTATADTTLPLCGQYQVGTSSVVYHAVIHAVDVSTGSAGGVTLYNSSFTATGAQTIGPINTANVIPTVFYDVVFPNGLMYTKTGTAQVQILYQCY